jgi:DNA repair protein RadC
MHVDDADEVDELRKRLRRFTGRRALDQAEVIRVLLRLAIDDDRVRAVLVHELTTS